MEEKFMSKICQIRSLPHEPISLTALNLNDFGRYLATTDTAAHLCVLAARSASREILVF